MVRKTGIGLILALAVLYSPWWLALAMFGLGTVLLRRHSWLLLGPALFFDWLYGLPSPAGWPLATGIVTAAIPLALLAKRLFRWV